MQYRRFTQRASTLALMVCALSLAAAAQPKNSIKSVAVAVLHAYPSSKPVTQYTLYDVGTLGGGSSAFFNWDYTGGEFSPSPLNNSGQLAGSALLPNTKLQLAGSFLWSDGKLHRLPTLPHGDRYKDGGSNANGVNATGLVIGASAYGKLSSYNQQNFYHAVSWSRDRVTDLGDLGGGDSWAEYVNNHGLIVGYAHNDIPDQYSYYGNQFHATLWRNGKIRDLGTLGGTDSEAWTVNDSGQIIGNSFLNTQPGPPFNQPQNDAFVWSNGKFTDLGTLGGGFATPSAINRGGDVTVISFDASNQHFQSFLWSNGTQYPLQSLGGNFIEASTLNDWDLITGAGSDPSDANLQAGVWVPWLGVALPLGTIAGDTGSIGLGVNNFGVVVGGSGSITLSGSAYAHAFVWQNGQMQDLNTLVGGDPSLTLNVAYNINDRGEIAGLGTTATGDTHAFVLVPQSASGSSGVR